MSLAFLHSFSPVKQEQPKEKSWGTDGCVVYPAIRCYNCDNMGHCYENKCPKPNRRNGESGGPNATSSVTGVTMLQFYEIDQSDHCDELLLQLEF